jgi:pimeloyl-ACP methyl ester carboxylesterase
MMTILKSNALALLLTFAATAQAAALQLSPGAGVFEYSSNEALPDLRMRVFYHAPASIGPETPIWFVIHGANRNASSYRDGWIDHIKDENVLVLLPEFSQENFPGTQPFNLGNVRDAKGEIRPEPQWTYSIVERLFDHVREKAGIETDGYLIYGHSAGSQFVHRMLFLRSQTRAKLAVVANAGWYTMPQGEIEFPYGLGGIPVTEERLKSVFQTPVVVLLGDLDTDEEHHQLRRTPSAMTQGPHRFSRGQTFFKVAQQRATELDAPFAWSLQVVEGVAHSNAGMARAAAQVMRDFGK